MRKILKALTLTVVVLAMAAAVAACNNTPDNPAGQTVAVTGVTLNKSTLALTVDGKETLTATVAPADASDKSVTWSSSDAAVASVSAVGQVTAVKVGTATIKATSAADGAKFAECTVTVSVEPYDAYKFNGEVDDAEHATDGTGKLTAELTLSVNASDAKVGKLTYNWALSAAKSGEAALTWKINDKWPDEEAEMLIVNIAASADGLVLEQEAKAGMDAASETYIGTVVIGGVDVDLAFKPAKIATLKDSSKTIDLAPIFGLDFEMVVSIAQKLVIYEDGTASFSAVDASTFGVNVSYTGSYKKTVLGYDITLDEKLVRVTVIDGIYKAEDVDLAGEEYKVTFEYDSVNIVMTGSGQGVQGMTEELDPQPILVPAAVTFQANLKTKVAHIEIVYSLFDGTMEFTLFGEAAHESGTTITVGVITDGASAGHYIATFKTVPETEDIVIEFEVDAEGVYTATITNIYLVASVTVTSAA
jgi:hypothetical protein